MPFAKKQRLFERLAKDLAAPSTLQEARVRNELEQAYKAMKRVRKEAHKHKSSARSSKAKEREKREVYVADHGESMLLEEEDRSSSEEVEMSLPLPEVLAQEHLWSEPSTQANVKALERMVKEHTDEQSKALEAGEIVTGKERLEYSWKQLNDEWQRAFVKPIIKAFKVYFDHQAIRGVPHGKYIDPRNILPSRLVLTNKGGKELLLAELKARWVFGGHLDPEAGNYPTSSPTVSLIGHNSLQFRCVGRWFMRTFRQPFCRDSHCETLGKFM